MTELVDKSAAEMERAVFARALNIDAANIDHVTFYSPAEGPGRIVVTAVVEMHEPGALSDAKE